MSTQNDSSPIMNGQMSAMVEQAQAMRDNQQMYVSASLYVGDLLPEVTEAVLYEVFNSIGPVASIRVCRDSVTRRSLGYAYVNYYSSQDAETALETLNYIDIKGHPTRIMWSNRDPTLRKSGTGNIFVKNLDKKIDTKALYDTFSHFGPILSCKVAVDDLGASKGYGFVHYDTEESAKEAIEKVDGMLIGGKKVSVAPFIRRNERESTFNEIYTNLYIRNFPTDWEDAELHQFLEKYGEITSMMLKEDTRGRKSAFVNFAEPEMAKYAVDELNGAKLVEDDEPLLVCPHQDKARRRAMLRAQYDTTAQEQRNKFVGVNLYIKNLDDSFDDEALLGLFKSYGTVTSAKIMRDANGTSRGFGFVCFSKPEEATKAIAGMHLKLVKGKPLYVGLAEKREQRLSRIQQRNRNEITHGDRQNVMPVYSEMQHSMLYNQVGFRGHVPPQHINVPPSGRDMRMFSPLPVIQQQRQSPSSQNNLQGKKIQKNVPASGFKFTAQARNRTELNNQPNDREDNAFQKQMIGEQLFSIIARDNPELAGKITGMMLEIDNNELIALLNDDNQLRAKIDEAIRVLKQAS